MNEQRDPIKAANDSLQVLMAMCADLPARLGELDAEQIEGLLLAARGGAAMLENRPALAPAFTLAMAWWCIVHAEWTRRVHRNAAESRELERVFNLNGTESE
ncbi:MAG TPA: hypothetical protein PKJ41_11965 [Bryobacteraceae bacterium]|nr:hypothetical protein [Bryobacteraceae bacterium]HPT28794.1 hypothetical protein [Bryobacteraceae bacterium]